MAGFAAKTHQNDKKNGDACACKLCSAMINSLLRFVPWQLTLLLVAMIYLLSGWLVWQIPCEDSLFVGLCGLGKLFVSGIFAFTFVVYGAFMILFHLASKHKYAQAEQTSPINAIGLVAGLVLSVMAIIMVIFFHHD